MAIARLNFLVVEDHDFQRKMLVRILHGIGANAIYEAKDGVGALAILQEPGKPVDIIISALDMPGMDGMAFVRNRWVTDLFTTLEQIVGLNAS